MNPELTQVLIDITRGRHRADYMEQPDRVIAGAPLEEPLRRAIREQDMGALWLAGAHPMALLYFARACGWPNERYYACLGEAELRKADPGAAAAADGFEP
jgi:hypothetical protein